MGILNIDEHVEEHRLMAIRYPDKAVIPGQSVIAQSNIPFLIMPGDGGANGCTFTGTAGEFTLSAEILATLHPLLDNCFCYFSDNFGGSTLPAGWYFTQFSSTTAGIVYADTYTSGKPRIPSSLTPIPVNLTGRITSTTNEVTGPSGFLLPGNALGKTGSLSVLMHQCGSTAGNKSFRVRSNDANTRLWVSTGTSTAPSILGRFVINCMDSHTKKFGGRQSSSAYAGLGSTGTSLASSSAFDVDTSVDRRLYFTLQGSNNLTAPILTSAQIDATYGD